MVSYRQMTLMTLITSKVMRSYYTLTISGLPKMFSTSITVLDYN